MAESTTTLQALRRAIALELRMDFHRRYPAGYVSITGTPTTTVIESTVLTQEDNFWAGAWAYIVEGQGSAPISASTASGTNITLELPLASAPVATNNLEIYNIWNAYDIHNAINRAIELVNRVFMDSVADETLVIQEDTLQYALSSLAKKPWVVAQVYIENASSVKRGVLASATGTTFVVENSGILSDVTSSWRVSIYAGTGKGQTRSIVSVLGATGTVATWTTIPDSTSKYALWNPTKQSYDWSATPEWYLDAKEYPDTLYLRRLYTDAYGLRMRLIYTYVPTTLSAEADTTIIPKEYLIPKACSILHGQAASNTKFDHNLHMSEFQRYDAIAQNYLMQNMPHKPDIMLKSMGGSDPYIEEDPLGWMNRR